MQQPEIVYQQTQPTYDYTSQNSQNYYSTNQQTTYNAQNYHPADQDYYNQYEPRLTDEQMSRQVMETPHNGYYGRHVRQIPPYEHLPKYPRRKSKWQEEQDKIYRSPPPDPEGQRNRSPGLQVII